MRPLSNTIPYKLFNMVLIIAILFLGGIFNIPIVHAGSASQDQDSALTLAGVNLPFSDNFSTDKGWTDESNGNIYRDIVSKNLNWRAERDQPQRYYIPINGANPNAISFSFRFMVTGAAGNGGIYAGLVENLNAPATIWASDATGVFVGLNDDTAFGNKVAFLSMYSDGSMDGVDNQVSTLDYGGQNIWRRLSFVLNNGNWTIYLMNDNGTLIGQMSGTLSQTHPSYNYFMIFLDYTPGWEWERGLIDDLKVENFVNLPFSDDFSTDKGWTDVSNGNIYRDTVNQRLSWRAERDQSQRYYIPINGVNPNAIRFSFRFMVTGAAGNGGIYAGLVENLNAPATIWASDATGVFVGMNDDTSFGNKVAFLSMYSDGSMDGVDNQVSNLDYGGQNIWRRLSFVLDNGKWAIYLMNDDGTPIAQMSGTLSQTHPSYNYFMIFLDYTPGWEWETGLIDDLKVEQLVKTTSSSQSTSLYDGWIMESSETSNLGSALDFTSVTINVGDGTADRQYRAILSFNTASIPDNAVITKVTLRIRKQGLVGSDPFTILGKLKVDMRKPSFGTIGLTASDFQAAAGRVGVATFGATPVNNWYSALLTATGRSYINKTGSTQFRLYFATDDNNDNGADYIKFISGNHTTASVRPTLIIEYYIP